MLGEWPVAIPVTEPPDGKPSDAVQDPWLVAALPVAPLGELAEEEPAPQPQPEPEQPEPDTQPELEPEPEPEPQAELEPEPVLALPPADAPVEEEPAAAREARVLALAGLDSAAALYGTAQYSIDPFAEPPARRRFGRGGGEAPATIEVPARPAGVRSLPGTRAGGR
jgi:hypothetical protein